MNNYKLKKRQKRSWWLVALMVTVLVGVVTVTAVVYTRHWYYENLKALNTSQKTRDFTIHRGASLAEIANDLKTQKFIKNSWAFKRYVVAQEASDKIKAGTYELSPSQSVPEIVAIITEGKVASNLVTILPGQRIDQVKKTLLTAGFSESDVDKALDPATYQDHPALVDKPAQASLEGYLYPESFQRTTDTQAQVIVKRSLDEMQKRLTPEIRAAFAQQGFSVYQGITIASIVEQEAAKPEERAQVAQVIMRRLSLNMALESDPTAFYGAKLAGQTPSLQFDSPYNTYLHKGLPPGPISNVSASSLQAAAHPANTDWLFFVAGDDGSTYFSHTHEEHQALIEKYCKMKCNQAQ